MRLLLLSLLALTGCASLDRDNGAAGDFEDVYRYTAYDEAGRAVVTGTLYVVYLPSDVVDEPDRLQGRWALDATAEGVGPQDGTGALEGTIGGGAVSVNLNPGMADDNVYLHGQFEDARARMTGEWSYATYAGPQAGGRFEAVRTRQAPQQHVGG